MLVDKLFNIPRRIRQEFYVRFNRMKFTLCGVKVGKNMQAYTSIYLQNRGYITIGDDFIFTSSNMFNPLCRNIRGGMCAFPGAKIIIGNNVGVSSACIWSINEIRLGNNVLIGGDSIILDSDVHSLDHIHRRTPELDVANRHSAPVIIEDDVLIGTRAIVLKGVHIGPRTIIAAGSVVTRDIPSDCIAGGNPCRVIRYTAK